MKIAADLLHRFTNNNSLLAYVKNMVRMHMQPNTMVNDQSRIKKTNRMFDQSLDPIDLIYLALADRGVDTERAKAFLFERYEIYKEYMARPYVDGQDLIKAGVRPNPNFSKYMIHAHKLRLAGVDKETALKQTLEYIREIESST